MGIEIAAIAALASGGLGIMEEQEKAKNEQDFLERQEALARQEAQDAVDQSERIAGAEEEQAIETARRSRISDRKRLESERARMASSGVSLTEGTPLKIEEENDITSRFNANDIFNDGLNRAAETRFAGRQKERSLLFEANELGFQRKLSKRTAKTKMFTGAINTVMGGLGGQFGAGGGAGGAKGGSTPKGAKK
jgi:hypothetical protein